MEAVGGSILSACFDGVIDRLKSIDWLKYVDQGHVLDQFNKWEKILQRIYVVLDDAEEMQYTSRLVDIWLTDLRDLAYDLEDVLDEITTEVQQRDSEDGDVKIRPSKVRKLINSFSAAVNLRAFKFNAEMISKIDMITARLDEIMKEKDYLNFRESNRRIAQMSERLPSTSLVNEAKVCGREEDKNAILELLDAATDDADIAVIPIFGMGGVGKTTLAQLIYNDNSLQFDFKAWVSVGEDFDIFRITKTVLQSNDIDTNLNSLQVKLKQKLSGKKFLVILDDVWSESYEQWTLFRGPFETGALGSRIIITSRSRGVALMTAGIAATHHLKELSYEACLSVFCQHALGATNFEQHLDVKPIGEEIVKRCKGLPLAAKALGGLLRGIPDIIAWTEVLKSEIWDLPENKSNILPALRLSYLYLPPHLKQCFAYCSIFPKDYKFGRDELVLLWMAEGFICPQKMSKQTEDLGHQYFDDLLSRSFFQQSNDNKPRFMMHDLINDLARFVSKDTCFHLVDSKLEAAESYAYIRYSSFIRRYYNISRRFECFYTMLKLRTFLSVQHSDYDRSYLSKKVLFNLLPGLKCLRVLSLTSYYFTELPSCVGELKHLRYLDLSYTSLRRLPESIGKLYNLETLKLHACYRLIELPKSICNLPKLLILEISETKSLKEMPELIGNLTSLRMLSKFIIGEGSNGLKISELKKLSQLAGKLEIQGLNNVNDIKGENFLKEKRGLVEVHLKWDYVTVQNPSQDEQILKSLEPYKTLLSLSITKYSGTLFLSWIGDPVFVKMVKLQLDFCQNIRSLPSLGRLPSLKELIIEGLNAVEEVGSEFYEDDSSFPCLETLQIRGMLGWKYWSWNDYMNEDSVGKFHKLLKFKIENCPKFIGKLPSFLSSLEELEISECQQLTDLPGVLPSLQKLSINACQEAILKNLLSVPSLTELKIERMKGLQSLDESYNPSMTALQKLVISQCHELKYLWTDETNLDNLAKLTTLNITSCKEFVSLVKGEERLLPSNLESLELLNCQLLKELPEGLNNLKSLKRLVLYYCSNLEVNCSSQMPYLETLEVRRCKSVSFSPNDKFSDSLKILRVGKGAKQLLESLYYGFSRLMQLKIFGCYELESFPGRALPDIPTLKLLTISRCNRLKSLSTHMQNLGSLQYLNIWNCDEFESFPKRGLQIPPLVSFKLNGCRKLKNLPNQMQNNTSLQCLYIRGTQIMSLEGCLALNITELVISDCKNLSQPMEQWGLRRLTSLRKFTIAFNTDMASFPDCDGLLLPASLIYLIISDFKNMVSVSRGIRNLVSLRELVIARCARLESFPVECLPVTLECVDIYQCPLIQDWCSKEQGEYGPIISYSS